MAMIPGMAAAPMVQPSIGPAMPSTLTPTGAAQRRVIFWSCKSVAYMATTSTYVSLKASLERTCWRWLEVIYQPNLVPLYGYCARIGNCH
eukprot:symbB.v1.2.034717.t1/scaffold4527.1/size38447/2